MLIKLKKIGTTLISRPAGREAYLAIQSSLHELETDEEILVDFEGVDVLTPSWADEFITPLMKDYKGRIKLKETDNLTVKETLAVLG